MTQGKSPLDQWWDGLTQEARAEAMRAYEAAQLTDDIANSLVAAGIQVSPEERRNHRFPGQVYTYLKSRHGT